VFRAFRVQCAIFRGGVRSWIVAGLRLFSDRPRLVVFWVGIVGAYKLESWKISVHCMSCGGYAGTL